MGVFGLNDGLGVPGVLEGLYGRSLDSEEAKRRLARIECLERRHFELFGCMPQAVFSTAGRTELGGNHTDHNNGKVIAGSIDLDTIAAVHETMDYNVTLLSEGYPPVHVDISDLSMHQDEQGRTESLVRGMAAAIARRGGCLGGFEANTDSSIFKGSGLSSSAAIEVLLGTIFDSLFNDGRFSTTEIAIMGQEAENAYFGKPSGLMDQVACANGGIVGIDFKDASNPLITPLEVDFLDYGYDYIVVNTGGSHADLTCDYSSIPSEMKKVAGWFGKEVLREVPPHDFFESLEALRKDLSNDRAVLRAYHFFRENDCVDGMLKALETQDFNGYLSLVRESGESSFKFLQNIYSPGCSREQGISLAYAMAETFLGHEGAYRVQGGGFAGTIEAYVPHDRTSAFEAHMAKVFGSGCCTKLSIRNLPTMRIK